MPKLTAEILISLSEVQAGAIETISADDIKASVDLTDYEAGTYEDVPLIFALPEGITMVSEGASVTVTIS